MRAVFLGSPEKRKAVVVREQTGRPEGQPSGAVLGPEAQRIGTKPCELGRMPGSTLALERNSKDLGAKSGNVNPFAEHSGARIS